MQQKEERLNERHLLEKEKNSADTENQKQITSIQKQK
jgi:hypothetical protein